MILSRGVAAVAWSPISRSAQERERHSGRVCTRRLLRSKPANARPRRLAPLSRAIGTTEDDAETQQGYLYTWPLRLLLKAKTDKHTSDNTVAVQHSVSKR